MALKRLYEHRNICVAGVLTLLDVATHAPGKKKTTPRAGNSLCLAEQFASLTAGLRYTAITVFFFIMLLARVSQQALSRLRSCPNQQCTEPAVVVCLAWRGGEADEAWWGEETRPFTEMFFVSVSTFSLTTRRFFSKVCSLFAPFSPSASPPSQYTPSTSPPATTHLSLFFFSPATSTIIPVLPTHHSQTLPTSKCSFFLRPPPHHDNTPFPAGAHLSLFFFLYLYVPFSPFFLHHEDFRPWFRRRVPPRH